MTKAIIISLLGLLPAVTGCAHRLEIDQGNVITTAQLARIAPGMDKKQVQYLLGTPLLADPFHSNRWDYYYSHRAGDGEVTRHRATVLFDGSHVARVETAGDIPAYFQPAPSYQREGR